MKAPLLARIALAALPVVACERGGSSDRPPERPPAAPSAAAPAAARPSVSPHRRRAAAPADTLTAAARAALARGNVAMRAKRHRDALAAYREAAVAAPHHAAPQFGIQMAARALGDSALVDSAGRRLRVLAPTLRARTYDDTSSSHTLPPGHPGVP